MARLAPARHRLHGMDAAGNAWMYSGTPNQWTSLGGPFSAIDGNDHYCFALSADGQTVSSQVQGTTTWTGIGGPMSSIEAAGNALYGLDAAGKAWRYNGTPMQWTSLGGSFTQLATWGVRLFGLTSDKLDVLEYRDGLGDWMPVAGGADTICAGSSFVAGLQGNVVVAHPFDAHAAHAPAAQARRLLMGGAQTRGRRGRRTRKTG